MTGDRPRAFNSTLPARSEFMSRGAGFAPSGSWSRSVPLLTTGKSAAREGRPETGFSRKVKLQVRARAGKGDPDDARCEATDVWLGRYGGEIQHRDARGMGGTSDPVTGSIVNAVLLSTEAHRLAESRDRAMNCRGFWLRQGQHPATTPILLRLDEQAEVLVWLGRDGSYIYEPPEGGDAI